MANDHSAGPALAQCLKIAWKSLILQYCDFSPHKSSIESSNAILSTKIQIIYFEIEMRLFGRFFEYCAFTASLRIYEGNETKNSHDNFLAKL